MNLQDFLLYMQGSGVNVIIGVLMSFLIEWWPEYENLESKVKRAVFLALCMVVPLSGALLGTALGYQVWAIEPTFWYATVAGWAAFGSGQLAHMRKM